MSKVNWLSSIPLKYKEDIVRRVNEEAKRLGDNVTLNSTEVQSTYQVVLNIKSKKLRNKTVGKL